MIEYCHLFQFLLIRLAKINKTDKKEEQSHEQKKDFAHYNIKVFI